MESTPSFTITVYDMDALSYINTITKLRKQKFNPIYKSSKNNLLKVSLPTRRQNVRNEPHL